MGSLTSKITVTSCQPIGYFNTGTIYDLLVGDAVKGYDGKWYIRGGLGPFGTGLAGWNNTYKSTIMDTFIGRIMAIYPGIESFIVDTEGVKTTSRVVSCADELGSLVNTDDIKLVPGATNDIDSIWTLVKDIGAHKEKHKADYLVETPFIDGMTGKRMMTWLPTILAIDSFSELMSDKELEMVNAKEGIGAAKNAMAFMVDGAKKALFIRHLRPSCERSGIALIAAAHLGNNATMETYPGARPKKQMQFMKGSDKLKGVSSKFAYLIRNHLETTRATVLLDSNKQPLYSDKMDVSPTDINEVQLLVARCKNNNAGTKFPFICSQSRGMLNAMSYYHYLREQRASNGECVGFNGNTQRAHACALLPDVSLSRNTVRKKIRENPLLLRALEICAHLVFIKQNWPIVGRFPQLADLTPELLFEKLQKVGSSKVDEILASRCYWTTRKDDRPYMSILDIVEFIDK